MFSRGSQKYIQHSRHQLGRYESIPCVSSMSADHRHACPVHGVNKADDKCQWNRGSYPDWGQAMAWLWCCATGESPWWLWQCGFFAHPMSLSPSRMHLHNVHLFFDPYSAIRRRNTELTFIWEEDPSPLLIAPMLTNVAHCSRFCRWRFVRIGRRQWILLEVKRRRAVSALMGRCCVPMVWRAVSVVVVNRSCRSCRGVVTRGRPLRGRSLVLMSVSIVNVICICNDMRTLSCLAGFWIIVAWRYIEVTNVRLAIEVCIYTHTNSEVHEHFQITNECLHLPPMSIF